MNSNIEHELTPLESLLKDIKKKDRRICYWSELYKIQEVKGEIEDFFFEAGCYICPGRIKPPGFCDAYTPVSFLYTGIQTDYEFIDNIVLDEMK